MFAFTLMKQMGESLFHCDRLNGLPVGGSQFLGLSIRNNWSDLVQAAVHAMDLEFDSEFSGK